MGWWVLEKEEKKKGCKTTAKETLKFRVITDQT